MESVSICHPWYIILNKLVIMKSFALKSCLLVGLVAVVAASADAQRTGRRRNPATNQPATNQPTTTTNNTTQPSGYNPYGNVPIEVDSMGMSDTVVKKSLRNDNAYDKSMVNSRTPLVYEHLRADDALFAEKVWRELDLREKMNQTFRYKAESDNGSQIFVDILLKAVNTGQVTAFSDDRFTTPVMPADIATKTQGQNDTVPVTDPLDPTRILKYKVTRASFNPESVTKIAMKEEWVFDRESSRMFCPYSWYSSFTNQAPPEWTTNGKFAFVLGLLSGSSSDTDQV
jgi:hypothetical protein